MRALALLTLSTSLAVGACAPDADAPGPPAARAEATEADRLLAAVDRSAFDAAFQEARRLGYTADLDVTVEDGAGATVGTESLTVAATPRSLAVTDRQQEGTLAGGDAEETPRLRDPLESALPDDPPYAAPSTRDQYRREVVGDTVVAGRRLAVVEATLTEAGAEQAVRRVRAAVDPESGQPVAVEVHRAMASAMFDEGSHVRVSLAPGPGGRWLPRTVETDATVDVPLSPARRVRTVWTVREVGGQPLGGAE